MTALLDNLVFYLAFRHSGHILGSQILARVFAVGFNYSMVRRSVFYSKQRHKTVLPKYLLLVLVSGTVSYAGIRLLSAKLGINPVSAKLMVETVLFFANFAVQRMFIFKPQAGGRGPGAGGQGPAGRGPGVAAAARYRWRVGAGLSRVSRRAGP